MSESNLRVKISIEMHKGWNEESPLPLSELLKDKFQRMIDAIDRMVVDGTLKENDAITIAREIGHSEAVYWNNPEVIEDNNL